MFATVPEGKFDLFDISTDVTAALTVINKLTEYFDTDTTDAEIHEQREEISVQLYIAYDYIKSAQMLIEAYGEREEQQSQKRRNEE